ncbi:hypothetical protein HK104_000933 [Borealophlyctis nickersoniae]|nr:hypothetical protein HK104_000933 [Borealophlyctis nickersoniae]
MATEGGEEISKDAATESPSSPTNTDEVPANGNPSKRAAEESEDKEQPAEEADDEEKVPANGKSTKRAAEDSEDKEQRAEEANDDETDSPRKKRPRGLETSLELPSGPRVRKSVDRLSMSGYQKQAKPIEIPKGKGQPLGDIAPIAENISKRTRSDDILIGLHLLIWGKASQKNLKSDLLKFHGFDFQNDKEHDNHMMRLGKWTMAGLKDLCQILRLESSGTKDAVVERIFTFLKNPQESDIKGGGSRRKRSVSQTTPRKKKGDATSDGEDAEEDSEPQPKKRASKPKFKSAFELFASEQRAEAEKEGGEEDDIQKRLTEKWEALAEEDKKEFEERFAKLEASAKTPTKKTPTKKAAKKELTKAVTPKKRGRPAKASKKVSEDESEEEKVPAPKKRGRPPKSKELVESEDEKDGKEQGKADGKGGEPTDEQLVAHIKMILEQSALETLTRRGVREQLEAHYGVNFAERKKFINDVISENLADE